MVRAELANQKTPDCGTGWSVGSVGSGVRHGRRSSGTLFWGQRFWWRHRGGWGAPGGRCTDGLRGPDDRYSGGQRGADGRRTGGLRAERGQNFGCWGERRRVAEHHQTLRSQDVHFVRQAASQRAWAWAHLVRRWAGVCVNSRCKGSHLASWLVSWLASWINASLVQLLMSQPATQPTSCPANQLPS
jgi:hypothetical protein